MLRTFFARAQQQVVDIDRGREQLFSFLLYEKKYNFEMTPCSGHYRLISMTAVVRNAEIFGFEKIALILGA